MPKAIAGASYIIVKGDTLSGIASQAYGLPAKWRVIWDANKSTLKSDDPNLIFPGEVILIPSIPEIEPLEGDDILPGESREDFAIIVDGQRLLVQSARALRTMHTAADGWNAVQLWPRDDEELQDLVRPYAYQRAQVYVGGQLVITGQLYTPTNEASTKAYTQRLMGASYTKDVVDSSVQPPYEYRNLTIDKLAKQLVEPLGIDLVIDDGIDIGGPFERVTATASDKIFDFLAKLARQRSLLISSTPRGELLLTAAKVTQSVGSIGDELPPGQEITATFDGAKRFHAYTVLSKRRGRKTKRATAIDDVVPRSRLTTIQADETTTGDIQKSADWERSKRLADALTIPFPVSDWYAPDNSLWRENTIVTVKSPIIYAPFGFDFMIKSVEYKYDKSGRASVLNLVPPEVYTGEPLVEPWAED
jgi:prophage tail gpP-like protein